MKPKKQKRATISLSADDVSAILCALPLISYLEADTEAQTQINNALMVTATEKLLAHIRNFTPNEIRIIYIAIACGANLTTYFSDGEIDAEWKAELAGHFFTLNRLYQQTKDFILPQN